MRLASIALALCAAAAASSCNFFGNQYPPGYQERFMAECGSGGASQQICSCAWDKVRQQFTVAQYDAVDTALKAGQPHPDQQKLFAIGMSCAAPAAASTPPTQGGAPFGQPGATPFGQAQQAPSFAPSGSQNWGGAVAQASGAYSPQMEQVFMSDCTGAGGPQPACMCIWNRVRAEFSVADFQSLDQASRNGTGNSHPLMQRYMQMATTCGQEYAAGAQSAPPAARFPAPGSNATAYPAYVRTNFVNACTGGGAPAAVCECGYAAIAREYTFDQFVEMDQAAASNQPHHTNARVREIMQACTAQYQ